MLHPAEWCHWRGQKHREAVCQQLLRQGTKGVVAGLTPLCLMLQERALPLAPADAPGEQFEVAQLLQALADAQGEQARLQLLLREAEEARQALEEGQEQLRDFEDLLACVGAQETKVGVLSKQSAYCVNSQGECAPGADELGICKGLLACMGGPRVHGECHRQASRRQVWHATFSS